MDFLKNNIEYILVFLGTLIMFIKKPIFKIKKYKINEYINNFFGAIIILIGAVIGNNITTNNEKNLNNTINESREEIRQLKITIESYQEEIKRYEKEEIDRIGNDLEKTKHLAGPNYLIYKSHRIEKISEGYKLIIELEPTKNEILGRLFFEAILDFNSPSEIIKFIPPDEGKYVMMARYHHRLSTNKKGAELIFTVLGGENQNPFIELFVTDISYVTIKGDHLEKDLTFEIK